MKLSKPITAHGETIEEITLKRPTVAQARKIGELPYRITEGGLTTALETACRYVAACADIPPSSVDQLELNDLNALVLEVVGFFVSGSSATSSN